MALKLKQNGAVIPQKLQSDLASLLSPKGYLYAGLPHFKELFGRDAIISAWQLLGQDPRIAKNTLIELARLQADNGMIIHEYCEEKSVALLKKDISWWRLDTPYYFSADSTPLFLILAGKYLNQTGDISTIELLGKSIASAAEWTMESIRGGLARYDKPPEGQGLLTESWKDGIGKLMDDLKGPVAPVEVQGYTYCAFTMLPMVMGNELGRSLSSSMQDAAAKLKEKFDSEFWNRESGFFHLAIGGDGSKISEITSNPGHLLFTGILDKEKADAVVKKLFSPEMLTRYGIRTHSSSEPDFDERSYQLGSVWPHDNWIIAQGLRDSYKKEYELLRESTLRIYRETMSSAEFFGVSFKGDLIKPSDMRIRPCDPQAWTVGAFINFLSQ